MSFLFHTEALSEGWICPACGYLTYNETCGNCGTPYTDGAIKFDTQSVSIDYENERDFEIALNKGENVIGKVVQFTVDSVHPDSAVGFNLWAGEHLNFTTSFPIDIHAHDVVVAKISNVITRMGSWLVSYEIIEVIKSTTESESTMVQDMTSAMKAFNDYTSTQPSDAYSASTNQPFLSVTASPKPTQSLASTIKQFSSSDSEESPVVTAIPVIKPISEENVSPDHKQDLSSVLNEFSTKESALTPTTTMSPATPKPAQESTQSVNKAPIEIDTLEYRYIELEDGTISITEYKGKETDIVIPDIIDGKTVSRVGDSCFSLNNQITNVELPVTVTTIENGAFASTRKIQSVTINAKRINIEQSAFSGASIKRIEIKSEDVNIGSSAFSLCMDLKNLCIVQAKRITIGDRAFASSRGLESI